MKTADKQKMCTNCHGRITVEAETCLYCGQEQTDQNISESSMQTTLFEQQSLQDSLTSLYSPPYAAKRPSFFEQQQQQELPKKTPRVQAQVREIPEPKRAVGSKEDPLSIDDQEIEEESPASTKGSLWSLLLMILGGNVFTLGLMQLFFSEGSRLRLEWQTDNWYLYCLAAVPLLFVGYRLTGKLKN